MCSVHVCLVSDQLVPNVLPVLHESPMTVVLLGTSQMENKTMLLASFLKSRGVRVEVREIPAYDFAGVIDSCQAVIADYRSEKVSLNVTGGTKVAALAAYQQFYFDGLRVIYVDTANNVILELGDEPRALVLEGNLLKVKDYLACYGKQFVAGCSGRPSEKVYLRRTHTAELAGLLLRLPDLIVEINRQVSAYKEKKGKPYFGLQPETLPEEGKKVCSLLRDGGWATPGVNGSVNINTEEDLFYLGGGWLEEFVYNAAGNAEIHGMDLAMNIEIEWQSTAKSHTRNEVDVAFTACNRLHIISCKSSGLDRKGGKLKGKEALYELDSLADHMGGLFARSMLVSAHKIGKASRQRADDLGICVVDGMDVLGIGKYIQNRWLS